MPDTDINLPLSEIPDAPTIVKRDEKGRVVQSIGPRPRSGVQLYDFIPRDPPIAQTEAATKD